MSARARSRFLAALLAVGVAGCSSGAWDYGALRSRHPELRQFSGHRLHQSMPYFALAGEGFELFLCRWATETIPVWLPPERTPRQSAVFERALAAWEGAGLGIRFDAKTWQGTPPRTGIVFELVDAQGAQTATTIADCAIPQQVEPGDTPIDAELQYASIHLSVGGVDVFGRPVALDPHEVLGAVVHEIGHALGFAGHVDRGESVMSSYGQIDNVRRWGRRIEAGEPLEAPSLAALYALPSGVRVGSLPLVREQLDPLRDVSEAATVEGLRGPWSRSGSESASLLWRNPADQSATVVVEDWPTALEDPTTIAPRPNRRARLLGDRTGRR